MNTLLVWSEGRPQKFRRHHNGAIAWVVEEKDPFHWLSYAVHPDRTVTSDGVLVARFTAEDYAQFVARADAAFAKQDMS